MDATSCRLIQGIDIHTVCMSMFRGTLHFTVPADVVGVSRLPKPHHQPQFHIHTPVSAQQTTAVRLCTPPPAKCPQTAIHYSQTQVDYLYLSQKDAAGFIMPTSRAFMLISNLYSPVRPSCCASLEVAILAVSATPMGADRIRGTERSERIWVRVRV